MVLSLKLPKKFNLIPNYGENQTSQLMYLTPIERNPQSYEEAVEEYKTFLKERGEWIDNNIDALNQYCHESRNKLYIE